jgi:hypothetical protein
MAATLNYPVFLLASSAGVVVIRTEDHDCITLFHQRELAQRELERVRASHPALAPLQVLAISNQRALRDGLRGLPRETSCVVWGPAGTPSDRVSLEELLRSL